MASRSVVAGEAGQLRILNFPDAHSVYSARPPPVGMFANDPKEISSDGAPSSGEFVYGERFGFSCFFVFLASSLLPVPFQSGVLLGMCPV